MVSRFRSRESLVSYCSQLEVDSAVDWEPVQLFKQRSNWSAGIRLKDNMGERVLNSLEFKDDRVRCTLKN